MKIARSSASRRRGLAAMVSTIAVASLVLAGAQQPPASPATPAAKPAAPAVPTLPAPSRAIVPVAASSVAARPDQWVGEYVAMTGIVEASLGAMAFTVDQDKTKAAPDVLVLAHRMSDPVAPNTYVTVIGLLMKYDPADVAAKSKAHAHDLEKRKALDGLTPAQMIAVQAAELARTEGGGAAWANVLAQQHGADAERRHAEDTRAVYDRAMAAMADVARSRAEAAPVVAGGAGPVVTVAGASGGSAALTRACKACGATIKADAGFCGACGATQA